MLIRIKASNFLSFNTPTEFNMLAGDYRRLNNHVYKLKGIDVLKFAAIYGANGSGKSNLIHVLSSMQTIINEGSIDNKPLNTFRLNKSNNSPISFEVEIISNGTPYIYGFEVSNGKFTSEWFYKSGLGIKDDSLIFQREDKGNRIEVEVNKSYTKTSKDKVLFEHYSTKILSSNKLLLTTLYEGDLKSFGKDIDAVWEWFFKLSIIFPKAQPRWFLYDLITDQNFKDFCNDILSKIDTGIKKLHIKESDFDKYFGEDDKKEAQEIKEELYSSEMPIPLDIDVLAILEKNEPIIKRLMIEHIGFGDDENKLFSVFDESDGTKRVIEYLVMLYSLIKPKSQNEIYIIDEIERSIHPSLIKLLLEKLSSEEISGQLIFSTHESNILDLKIFRPDEVWFCEKDSNKGNSHFYPLSEYDVRTDYNIQTGYLNGRFGAIPFLGDLAKVDWEEYAEI